MPQYEVITESQELIVTYSDIDSLWTTPINTITVKVQEAPEGDIVWEKQISDRFISTGLPKLGSFENRVAKAISKANTIRTMLS